MVNRKSKSKLKGGTYVTIQKFYRMMDLMITKKRNIFDPPTMKHDKQIITDKRNGADIDDMKVLQSMLNILNILLGRHGEEKTYIIPEPFNRMLEELREEVSKILGVEYKFFYHDGVKVEIID